MPLLRRLVALLTPVVLAGILIVPPVVANVPAGFSDDLVVAVPRPTAVAFLSAGADPDLLVTSQSGQVRYRSSGANATAVVLNLNSDIGDCVAGEQGLLGMAVGAGDQHLFLYYTHDLDTNGGATCENRVVKYDLAAGNPPVVSNPEILIQGMPSNAGNHNGGDLQFGLDGLLYVSVGEVAIPDNAQRTYNLLGKILRLTEDGDPAPGNPFTGANSASCANGAVATNLRCQEIYAYGLRNPYRIAVSPDTGALFINDVGQNTWEEINRGKAGANYGWPRREGFCPQGVSDGKRCRPKSKPKGVTNPVLAYNHRSNCRSITGGAFVPESSNWPASYKRDYLYADFVCGKIFRLDDIGQKQSRQGFGEDLGGVAHLAFGPDGNTLYYLTYGGGGQLRAITVAP